MSKPATYENLNLDGESNQVLPNGIYRNCTFNGAAFGDVESSSFVDCTGHIQARTVNNVTFRRTNLEVYGASWSNVRGTKSMVAFASHCKRGVATEYPVDVVDGEKALQHYKVAAPRIWKVMCGTAMSFKDGPHTYIKTNVSHLYIAYSKS